MRPLDLKVVRETLKEWRAGEFLPSYQEPYNKPLGWVYNPKPDEERLQLRSVLREFAERAAIASGRLIRIRLKGENPYTLAQHETLEGFIQGQRDEVFYCRCVCAALRWLLKKLPPPTPPPKPKPKQAELFS